MRGRKALSVAGLVSGVLVAASAEAQELDQAPAEVVSSVRISRDGSLLPLAVPAAVGTAPAFAFGSGGYDGSRRGPLMDVVAEVTLWGPLAIRGGATYSNDAGRMRPSVGARGQLLRQSAHWLDGGLAVLYKAEGFTEGEGEIEAVVSLGRSFRSTYVLLNLAYGQDPEGNERDGEARASALWQASRLTYGFDSRARTAIGTQHGQAAMTEPKWDLRGGLFASYGFGRLALFAEAGPSVVKNAAGSTTAGVAAVGGLGAAFF